MEEIRKVEEFFQLSAMSPNFAKKLDKLDPLADFRSEFNIPLARDVIKKSNEKKNEAEIIDLLERVDSKKQCIYMTGNSLGLQPKKVQSVQFKKVNFELS